MNNRDTVIYNTYQNMATIEHHGKDYGVTAKVIVFELGMKNDGDGIITPFETSYEYYFQVDSLEIYDHDGNDLEMTSKSIKKLIEEVESQIIEFCKENTDKF